MSAIRRTAFDSGQRFALPDFLGTSAFLLNSEDRLELYKRNWDFYKSRHWTYARTPQDPLVTVNFGRAFVDKLAAFTFKHGFDIVVSETEKTAKNEDRFFVKKLLDETWRANRRNLSLLEAGQSGGVTGDVFWFVGWDNDGNEFLDQGFAQVEVIPSHFVFPEFDDAAGTDRRRMIAITFVFPILLEATSARESTHSSVRVERWTAEMHEVWIGEDLIVSEENRLGEIPVIHIPNYPVVGEFYGIADLTDLVDLNEEINEKLTDLSDIINYHASPLTYLIGASVNDLERGPNKVWGLPEGSTIGTLKLGGDIGASLQYIDKLKEGMHELSGVPKGALGSKLEVSNTPGITMALTLLPIQDKRDIKVMTYADGLRRVNRLILRYQELADTEFRAKMSKLTNRYWNEVMFKSPLPTDEAMELDKAKKRLDMGISSRRREMERAGVSENDIKRVLEEAAEERATDTDALFQGDQALPDEPDEPDDDE